MKELNDIVSAYEKAVLQQQKTALATVVQVIGSSYRRPGARMLVTEDGAITGAISGGCLEGDALRKAQFAMQQQQNRLEIYDTTEEDSEHLGVQLGCNGKVYILFEPILPENPDNPVELLKKLSRKRENAVLVTFFNQNKKAPQAGTTYAVFEEEMAFLAENSLKTELEQVFRQGISVVKNGPEHSVTYQFVPPTLQLLIVGAGNDVQPLSEMAALLGWHITVVDGRPAYATPQRFPRAHQVKLSKAADLLSTLRIDTRTAVVLMTHNYPYDLAALEQVLQTNCPYIGVLGPRKKWHKMLEDLAERGVHAPAETNARIYGPVGLDIGAETSEEIALAIMGEIKAVFSGRFGASLR